jgi:NAD(P)H-dependent nitrite reductase small subunit
MARRVRVAALDELQPGRGKLVQVEGRQIALFKVDGGVRAISAVCPHEGGPLDEGELEGERVYCPWHAYDFDLNTGACSIVPELRAPTYPVAIEDDQVLVELEG